jgi:predicted TIM-barrel fold metal-dependent hydrolase
MIIDAHVHLWNEDWCPAAFWDGLAERMTAVRRKKGERENITAREVKKNLFSAYWDPDGSKLIAEMDEAGIDLSVLLPSDVGYDYGEQPVSIWEQNKKIAEIARRDPQRLIAFVGVDPRREEAIRLLEAGVKEWGCRGLKLHPAAGFYPHEKAFYPLYRKAAELKVPVLTHTGGIIPPLKSKFVQPIHWDEVAVDIPQLQIICAHMGHGWWMELNQLVEKHLNVSTDCSGWQVSASTNYEYFTWVFRNTLNMSGRDRVLFGTDSPAYRLTPIKTKDYLQIIQSLPQKPCGTAHFTDEEIAGVLGENARRLLGV